MVHPGILILWGQCVDISIRNKCRQQMSFGLDKTTQDTQSGQTETSTKKDSRMTAKGKG